MIEQENRNVLLYVSHYYNKYYESQEAQELPEAVKKELLMNLIFISEEAGGVCELFFDEEGHVVVDSYCEEGDLGYDEVAARLLVSEMEHKEKEVLEQVENWHRLKESGAL